MINYNKVEFEEKSCSSIMFKIWDTMTSLNLEKLWNIQKSVKIFEIGNVRQVNKIKF